MATDKDATSANNLFRVAAISEGFRSTKEGTNLERTGSAPTSEAAVSNTFERPKGTPQRAHLSSFTKS